MATENPDQISTVSRTGKWRFIAGGAIIFAAVLYLVISSTKANAQYFLTVDELLAQQQSMQGQEIRVSGAVLGNSIHVDDQAMTVRFSMANIPGDQKEIDRMGGIAEVLHQAVNDPSSSQIAVLYNGVKPDLLQNEAQAIVTGKLRADGVFIADEVLLKCPTRYAEALPNQSE